MAELLRGLEMRPVVDLPSTETAVKAQKVVGKPSPVSSELEEFRGIPYGAISARWEHSRLRRRLPRDVFDATQDGPKCPQPAVLNDSRIYQSYLAFPDIAESEFECLNLFIVRPSKAALAQRGIDSQGARMPVLVWIHGGGFAFGAATDPMWDPSRLVLRSLEIGKPIVAACINHRLGLFGFAASPDLVNATQGAEIGGLNFGLRDQKVALTWISLNIAAFGGDPNKVTLAGQSAGSISTHVLLLEEEQNQQSQQSPPLPLFRRAILQSAALGTLGPESMDTASKSWNALCKRWGVGAKSGPERVEFLRKLPPSDLVTSAMALGFVAFPPVFDDVTLHSTDVATQHVKVCLGDVAPRRTSATRLPPIAVLLGNADSECCLFPPTMMEFARMRAIFEETYKDAKLRDRIMLAYGFRPKATRKDLQHATTKYLDESLFEVPIHLARKLITESRGEDAGQTVHSYHVEFGNPFPGAFEGGAHHCVELIYLFDGFHHALAKADEGVRAPYHEPGNETEAHASHATKGDWTGKASSRRTNMQLCRTVQDYWLKFIVDDDYKPGTGSSDVTVFDESHQVVVKDMDKDQAFVARRERWELLAKDVEALSRARIALRGK